MAQVNYAYVRLPDDAVFPDARETLAELFDIAINECGIGPDDFVGAFLASGVAREFERLNPVFAVGKSAPELFDIVAGSLGAPAEAPAVCATAPLVDYWVGWMLAYYQHETGTPFDRMFESVPYEEFAASYHPLHEAPDQKFLEVFEPRIRPAGNPTRLAVQRRIMGLSQPELADLSGVGLRSIQMYEQKNKNINRATAETVLRLSRALHCTMEDILEL
ncbi:MAG: helix-turn-helix transcriptional regulator [Eggerthellaceae bacterium]|nr:helix-turn-helix transcriptional regulator [Eggerthellaceae bacterium]